MSGHLTHRLFRVIPNLQRSVTTQSKQQHFRTLLLGTNIVYKSKYLHLNHPKQYDVDKYAELNNRLAAVPYLDLLETGLKSVRDDLTYENDLRLEDALKWCAKVFDYNVKNGKKIRGIALLKAYCSYAFNMDDDTWNKWDSNGWTSAVILAWCVELLQAYFIVLDDIMDQSILRRGELCWYKKPDVGLCAINDGLLLQCGVYKLLEKHFAGSECYNNVLHEFLQITHKTVYGQCLDMLFNPINQKPRYEKFTFDNYQTLVEYKTSNYTFGLPVHLAMHLVGGSSAEDFNFTRKLCFKLGLYFQSQDDYLDCFGNSKITGKFGNDIREGKCTWFSAKFLEEASETDKKQFLDNYGNEDKESIAKVLQLYKSSSMLEKFEQFDELLHSEIVSLINSMDSIKGGLFYNLFSQLRKREK
ncbi:farnesyl pyrophosphate synthase [Caerostris darwini]|uniref:Farnesyl pyrophosphate synthase n=1 Tax=Caerostris darwini TaxID=1538125 RepID=A0AAV4QQ49_9ARAC|nr:farnesyl pyrophosphate synthase [Caerostris darwini]